MNFFIWPTNSYTLYFGMRDFLKNCWKIQLYGFTMKPSVCKTMNIPFHTSQKSSTDIGEIHYIAVSLIFTPLFPFLRYPIKLQIILLLTECTVSSLFNSEVVLSLAESEDNACCLFNIFATAVCTWTKCSPSATLGHVTSQLPSTLSMSTVKNLLAFAKALSTTK